MTSGRARDNGDKVSIWVDGGIRDDGSLKPGVYRYAEIPVVSWVDEDRAKVEGWLQEMIGVGLGDVKQITVEERDFGQEVVEVQAYHRDDNGNAHLAGHCDGEPTGLRVAPHHSMDPDLLEVYCTGCDRYMGVVSSKIPKEDYYSSLADPHNDVCLLHHRFVQSRKG